MQNSGPQTNEFDIIVIGSGIAGLFAAIKAAKFARVCLLTKAALHETNTWLAQGGIAAALGEDDSPAYHSEDTLRAGAGLCDPAAVEIMVSEGMGCVRELLELGTPFDMAGGCLAMTREGAHRRNRILHAGGDATGSLIQKTLQDHILGSSVVTVRQHTFVTDILLDGGSVCGVRTLTDGDYSAGSVILATGGLGQVFSRTTNPVVATGDGVAMAYRAGAQISDIEFIQFHPTVFQGRHEGETFLLSEALRGEGAVLRNERGERFMDDYHEMAELGPRDIVARAIIEQMRKYETPNVYLDITHQDQDFLKKRFPTIYGLAAERGLDIARDWLPVAPAAHYAMGGVRTGLYGETNITGLYACGEASCSAVHGANRLASNSLLDGLVFAARAVEHINRTGKILNKKVAAESRETFYSHRPSAISEIRESLRCLMFQEAGILRHQTGLMAVRSLIENCADVVRMECAEQGVWELKNLVIVADLITGNALLRTESRGSHYRIDFPLTESGFARHLCRTCNQEDDFFAPIAV